MGHLTSDYGLCLQTSSFYRSRRHLGLIPTEEAMQCIRNEEARHGELPGKNAVSREKKRLNREKKPVIKKPLIDRQVEIKIRQPVTVKKPPVPEIDNRPPLLPVRISYLDTMSRKSL